MWAGFARLPRRPRRGAAAGAAASSGRRSSSLVVAFACAPPLLSHDVYSYVDYARLGVLHGLDPYVHAPDAAPADPAFAHVTWTEHDQRLRAPLHPGDLPARLAAGRRRRLRS